MISINIENISLNDFKKLQIHMIDQNIPWIDGDWEVWVDGYWSFIINHKKKYLTN